MVHVNPLTPIYSFSNLTLTGGSQAKQATQTSKRATGLKGLPEIKPRKRKALG